MTFLKKLGEILLKGTQIIMGFAPAVQSLVPNSAGIIAKVESELSQLAGIVTTVEAVGQALSIPGADKAKAAGPLVAQLILQSEFMVGKTIGDSAKFTAACTALGGAIADLLNSLKADVDTQNKA